MLGHSTQCQLRLLPPHISIRLCNVAEVTQAGLLQPLLIWAMDENLCATARAALCIGTSPDVRHVSGSLASALQCAAAAGAADCVQLLLSVDSRLDDDQCDAQGRGLLNAALAGLQAAWQLGGRGGCLSTRALQLQSVFRLAQSLLQLVINREFAFTGKLTLQILHGYEVHHVHEC